MGVLILRSSIEQEPPSESAITPSLVASRVSGPAPLAVHFDAGGTTCTGVADPFRKLGYYFHYGDTSPGNWAATGASKNTDVGGPLGAHLYETPGTYYAKVGVYNPLTEDFDQTQVEIVVGDPDSVYSGTNTICLSRNTDHTGAPSGATLMSNVTSWPTWTSNRRYLLHRGQDFTSLGNINLRPGLTDILIDDYSTGDDPPLVTKALIGAWAGWTYTTAAERCTIVDLRCVSDDDTIGGILFKHAAWVRCGFGYNLNHVGEGLLWLYNNEGTTEQKQSLFWPEHGFMIECYQANGANDSSIFGACLNWTLMGNVVTNPLQHCFRPYMATGAVIQHNILNGSTHTGGGNNVIHNIKLQAIGTDIPQLGAFLYQQASPATSRAVVRKNAIGVSGDTNSNWSGITIGPENNDSPQGIEYVIVEENDSIDFAMGVILTGRFLTVRGNVGSTPQGTDNPTFYGGGIINGPWDGSAGSTGANAGTNEILTNQIATQAPV